jgi:hypothetical protein
MIEFGPPIEVNGVRPAFINHDEKVDVRWFSGPWYSYDGGAGCRVRNVSGWDNVSHIRLPADHPHYTKDTAMTDEEIIAKGFKPFHGNTEPEDWDGARVLVRDSGKSGLSREIGSPGKCNWSGTECHAQIIGYHPKEPTKPTRIVIPDGPAPEWAVERWWELCTESAEASVMTAAKLVAMLEQPPVDRLEEAFMDLYNKSFDTQEELIRAALAKGIEMGKGEV